MPDSLPAIPGAKLVRALERAGFTVVRISGSHHVMRHLDGRTVVVPVHASRDMAKGTLRNILAIIGMDSGELNSTAGKPSRQGGISCPHTRDVRKSQLRPGAGQPHPNGPARRGASPGTRSTSDRAPGA